MRTIRLLDMGEQSPLRSQTVYHAAAYAMTEESPDTLILVSPTAPYASIGYHQDVEKEIDLGYCEAHKLPVIRREVGGGAVYLDGGQVFVQWVFYGGHLPHDIGARFELYARPIVETYQALGVQAYYRPINDIHVDGKKIGGTGAAWMGQADVVVGSLMFPFDKLAMTNVLKISSEKMRDKVFESLQQYMTTMQEQLDYLPDRETVKEIYTARAAAALGAQIVPGAWTEDEEAQAREIDARLISREWLYQRGGLRQSGVKIHQDVRVAEGAYKAPGGLIRATLRLHDGRIDDLALSGDFTLAPAFALAALEQAVRGLSTRGPALAARAAEVYTALNVRSPGVTPDDFVKAVLAAVGGER